MEQDVDLNLLAALDVLLAEGSVTAAASRLHLSVPATSRTLGRIRETFGDPMFVRAGRGLVPTPRALALQDRLHALVEEAHALVASGRDLDPGTLERTFTVRASDFLVVLLAGGLHGPLREAAPGVGLRFVAEGDEDLGPLRDGPVDLDVGAIGDLGPEVRVQPVYEERLVGLLAADHPAAGRRMTLRRLAALEHVSVSRRGRLDDRLAERGLARRVSIVVPTASTAAQLILGSALTGLIPASYASEVAARSGAWVYDVPVDLPPVTLGMAWHVRHDLDPAHRWLRDLVRTALTSPAAAVAPPAPAGSAAPAASVASVVDGPTP